MAEEHRGFYSPSSSSVLFQDLLWSAPNKSLNSQSDDNKTGSSTHLLDISMASTPLGSNHGPCWHPVSTTSHGSWAPACAASPCWWSHHKNPGAAWFPALKSLCFSELCHWWIRSGKSPLQMSLGSLTRRWLGMWIHLSSGTTAPPLQPAVRPTFLLIIPPIMADRHWCLSCTKTTQNSFGFWTGANIWTLLWTLLEDQV